MTSQREFTPLHAAYQTPICNINIEARKSITLTTAPVGKYPRNTPTITSNIPSSAYKMSQSEVNVHCY